MGHARRAGAYKTFSIASAAGAALLTALLAAPAVAAPGKGAELLASGVKSLEAGKPADAVTTLTSALSSGTLDSAGMAKALYYRGLAHRRQGRPAQAIADLTNAMWIKGGLSEAERTDATAQRAAAYQEAGVAGQGPAKVATAASPPSAPTAPASSPPTTPATGWQTSSAPARADRPARSPAVAATPDDPAPATDSSSPAVGSFFSNLFSGGSPSKSEPAAEPTDVAAPVAIPPPRPVAAAPPPPPAAVAPPTPPAATPAPAPVRQPIAATPASWQTATTPAAKPAPVAPPAAAPPAPAAAPSAAAGSSTSTIAGLFSNLFSGGAQSTAPTEPSASGVTTASTGGPTAAVSSWSGTTTSPSGKVAPAPQPIRTAAVASPPPAAVPTSRASTPTARQVQVQVASVRSRDAAATVADRLRKEHGFRLDARDPVIEEKVIGNMGTFYTVKIGPYPDQTEPVNLCQKLRPSGFDCLVLTE